MQDQERAHEESADQYDRDAAAIGWHGPEVVFGLAFRFTNSGEDILDIGIGTGLGSELFYKAGLRVFGMDTSPAMLGICRKKGLTTRLVRHDLTSVPYPFSDESYHHAVSTGVFQFFENLNPVFGEVRRILKEGGTFVFITGDRNPDEPTEIIVGPEQTGISESVTMYRHTPDQIAGWLEERGFLLLDTLEFAVWMDREQSKRFPARAYLAQKSGRPVSDRRGCM
jgi:predicted TPR repeat methyltransferase